MATPGDPHDHDDLVGFTSPSSLVGAERRAAPPPEPEPAPEPEPKPDVMVEDEIDDLFDDLGATAADGPVVAAEPEPVSEPETTASDDLGPLFSPSAPPEFVRREPEAIEPPEPRVAPLAANLDFDAPPVPARPVPAAPPPKPEPVRSAAPEPVRETLRTASTAKFGRSRRADPPEGAMGLYAVYALILFAVPTLGVSALIALFAVTTRPRPDQPLALSHFLFQQRTLWIAAVTAVIGVVLIAVNLGVFVLVIMALWVLIRGAAGVIRLAAGRSIAKPTTLLI